MNLNGARRIHIVGGPGSGKTTLAIALARRFGVPVQDLDDLAQGAAPEFRPTRPLALREIDIRRISDGSSWITEGSFLWWTDTLFERAQAIVWLDVPWVVAVYRTLTRHLRSYASDIACASGLRSRLRAARHPHARHLISFMWWSSRYYASSNVTQGVIDPDDTRALTRAATAAHLARYRSKLIRMRSTDVDEVLIALRRTMTGPRDMPARSQPTTWTGEAP